MPELTIIQGGALDPTIPYYSDAIKERLEVHVLTEDFVSRLMLASGGSFKPEEGGDWERVRRAHRMLRPLEEKSKLGDRNRLKHFIENMDHDKRKLLEYHAEVVELHRWTLPSLTAGEVRYYKRMATWLAISDIEDIVECISTAFPGAEESVPSPQAATPGTAEGETATPSAEAASPPGRKVRVLEDDLVLPDGYLEGTDVSGTAGEVKLRIQMLLHAHLVAEIQGKNRKGVTDWLISKLAGWKVPEEWRVEDES